MITISTIENFLKPTCWEILESNRKLLNVTFDNSTLKAVAENQDIFKASIKFQNQLKNIYGTSLSDVIDSKTWQSVAAYHNILSDLSDVFKSTSVIDYIDVSNIENEEIKYEESSLEESSDDFQEIETEIVNTLAKDDKFISWFRSKFPTFSNAPAEVIAKYFFCYIIAPIIVQYVVTTFTK